MSHIIFDEKRIELDKGQTVLSALLDRDYDIPNSCQAGVCQSCIMQAVDGDIPAEAQTGLKDTLIVQGYFLACSCQPKTPLKIIKADAKALRSNATVIEHEFLGTNILRLRLKTEHDFKYRAGQFITVWKNAKLGRSYSLASVADLDDSLELHIRRINDGKLSNWLHDEVKTGDILQIQAATGNCFYTPGQSEQKTLLAGTGTGLAPLIGIARDALQQGHQGDIHLIHGTTQSDELYLHKTLLEMERKHTQFHYHANVLNYNDELKSENSLEDDSISSISSIPLEQQVVDVTANSESNPAEWKVFLCGDEVIVNSLKKKLFLNGVSMTNIYSDPFVKANSP